MSKNQESQFKVGQIGFGAVNGYPPARWKFVGVTNSQVMGPDGPAPKLCRLEHVKHPSQSVAYPDQFVSFEACARIMDS